MKRCHRTWRTEWAVGLVWGSSEVVRRGVGGKGERQGRLELVGARGQVDGKFNLVGQRRGVWRQDGGDAGHLYR